MCSDVASQRGRVTPTVIKAEPRRRTKATADIQVHIKSTGYSPGILMWVERDLIWFRGSGEFFFSSCRMNLY